MSRTLAEMLMEIVEKEELPRAAPLLATPEGIDIQPAPVGLSDEEAVQEWLLRTSGGM